MSTSTLLRLATAGSVDDGKSTLIGRLLFDSKAVMEDQLGAVLRATERRGGTGADLSLLTDGLIAEREQGITIDVAYRYFATARRKFIIADTPGHEQYTRNMVTGASTADVTIVLVDAQKGVRVQSRRHAAVASLLGVPHVVVAINKLDLFDYSQSRYDELVAEFQSLTRSLDIPHVHFVPVSALHGDMIVSRGKHLPWYHGPTLLELLETIPLPRTENQPFRFPVQLVARPFAGKGSRGYMGRIESGRVRVGDRILVQPSGRESIVREIVAYDASLTDAQAPQSVTLMLDDEIDISRGDLLTHRETPALVARDFTALVCWMSTHPLNPAATYWVKQTTRTLKARVSAQHFKLDLHTLARDTEAAPLNANDIGAVTINTQQPLAIDAFADVHATGSFILIDEHTNETVAAGTIQRKERH